MEGLSGDVPTDVPMPAKVKMLVLRFILQNFITRMKTVKEGFPAFTNEDICKLEGAATVYLHFPSEILSASNNRNPLVL